MCSLFSVKCSQPSKCIGTMSAVGGAVAKRLCAVESLLDFLKGAQVKKGYWVVAYRSVSDESALKEYGKLAITAIEAGGGRLIIRTADAIVPHESGLKQRVVVVEFESFEKAVATYDSPAYRAA